MGPDFLVSERWRKTFPGAAAGWLALAEISNPRTCPALEPVKEEVTAALRQRFPDREAIRSDPAAQAYAAYYKAFKKTYHVAQQVESVALKAKPIPRVAALVEAMFTAELKNLLLTAGHDLKAVNGAISLDAATGEERYVRLSGETQQLKEGDMFMADEAGVISSVLYGPDQRSRITPATTEAVFAVYAPAGIGPEAVRAHLEDIAAYARLISPGARLVKLEVQAAP